MKKNSLTKTVLVFAAILSMSIAAPLAEAPAEIKFPKKVNNIIQAKCYGCHSPESRGEKSRAKLNWDELGNLETEAQIEKFQKIATVLAEGNMPPKRMVERNPDMAISEKESKKLQKWVAKMERKASK